MRPRGLERRTLLLLFLGLATGATAASSPLLQADVDLFRPACSQADLDEVRAAVLGASALLQSRCQLRLKLTGLRLLPQDSDWCHLPAGPKERSLRLQALVQRQKMAQPRRLGLFLLPTGTDERLSWAIVDQSPRSGCDSPQEARFLPRFGSFFFTDLTWMQSQARRDETGPSRSALLVAHEVLHALTQRGHPTGVADGGVMTDHVAAMGPRIDDDWCACARRSPFVRKP
jgi:hypothetical protein